MKAVGQCHNHTDATEQQPRHPKIRHTLLANPLREVCQALVDEMAIARTHPSGAFEVTEGSWVYGSDDGHLYTFRTDIAIPLPPETPVRLFVEGHETAEGVLVAQHDFDVLFQLRNNLGETVARARVSSEPWFIVAALRRRLEEEMERPAEDIRLPMALLGLDELPTLEDTQAATQGAQMLATLGIPSLVPNAAQRAALSRCIGSRLHVVWGPPGTGKTACLAQVVRTLVDRGERVLVVAHANAAVDVAILRVADACLASAELSSGKVLRLGVPQLPEVRRHRDILPETIIEHTQPELVGQKRRLEYRRQELSDHLRSAASHEQRQTLGPELEAARQQLAVVNEALRQALMGLMRNAQVVASTLSRLAIDAMVWNWPADAIILDETSMAGFPAVLATALRTRKRLLLFGDFRQLPPIHLAQTRAARRWLGRDAFEIIGVQRHIEAEATDPRVTLLDTQYRMAPPIAAVVSRLAYVGGYSPAGIIARIDNRPAVEVLEGLLLGPILAAPPPRAEVERALTGICGRCPNCGEDRRPHAGSGGTWVLRCANPRHRGNGLDAAMLRALAAAMEIRCPACQSRAIARGTGHQVFLGCGNYGRDCRGRLPTLDELFGGA